jgi:hypothetical protein
MTFDFKTATPDTTLDANAFVFGADTQASASPSIYQLSVLKTFMSDSPTLVTPNLGTPSAGTLTSCTGLPISTGVSGLGTGNATALAVNVGSAGAFVRNNAAETVSGQLTLTSATPQLTLGVNATTLGSIKLFGNTSGDVTLKVAAAAGTATVFQLPASNGTSGYFLQTDGNGVTSWAAASASPGGSDTEVQFNDGGAFGGNSAFTFNKTTTVLTTGRQIIATASASGATTGAFLKLTGGAQSGATNGPGGVVALATNESVGSNVKLWLGRADGLGSSGVKFLQIASYSGSNTLSVMNGDASVGEYVSFLNGIGWTGSIANPYDACIRRAAAATLQFGDQDAASPVAQTLQVQSVVAGTSNTAGVVWTRIGSKGSGSAAGGNIVEKTGFAGSSGTAQNSTVDREVIVAAGKALTDNTATSLFEIALPTLAMAGGVIEATTICTDGTDMQSVTETITYAAVNKGGAYTKDVDVQTTSTAASTGTIANTWAFLDGTNKITMQLTSDTSLSPTKFLVYYKVRNNSEQATTIV